ncbi:hypothetical protein D3C84_845880 [compost metagenome]
MQIAFRQVAEQGADFMGPGFEQAVNAKETFITGFLPQLTENRQAGITAVADDEGGFTGTASDGRRLIQTAFADRGLEVVVQWITEKTRVVLIRPQLLEGH